MINAGPLSARNGGEGDSMPRGINRPASQTGTWPPLCMLDRRSCGCLEPKPTAVVWHRDERSWPWKVQRQSFSVNPHLVFLFSFLHLLSLPVNLSLSSPDVLHSVSMPPFFPSVFHTSPDWAFILFIPILCCCISVCVLLSAAGQLQVNWLKETGGQKSTAQSEDRPFASHTASMWGVYYVNTTGMTSKKAMLNAPSDSLGFGRCWH